ncbi:MAG: ComEC/Rec2 family competence protein, partial [Oscillospiraceae bacterium]
YGVKASYGSLKAYGRGSVDSKGFHGKLSDMSLYLKEDGVVSAGDLISFSGKATFKKGGSLNPAVNFSSCEGLKVLPQKRRSLYCFLGKWGDIISRTALNLTEGEITRLFPALLTGNRSWLLPKQEKIISAGGISHLTAVSGMHLAILIYILNLLLGDCNKKLKFFAGNSLCLFAAGISAFTPSVMRAWLLVFLVLLGDCFNRRGDTLTSLGLYGILLCMLRPQWLFNVGAWLSVAAVMGISTFSPLITKGLIELCRVKSDGFWAGLIGVLSVTLSANIATLPIISASFGYISFWSVLSNLFIINLITPVMILLWLAVTLKIAFNIEAPLITYGAVKLSEISMELAEFFGELPPKMLGFSERYIKVFLIFIGIFV